MFKQDLQLGQAAEKYILPMLKKEFPTMKRVKGYEPDYDFIDDNGYTIELKLDKKSRTSGNIGIEYKHRNKPSAISTSKAFEWIIIYYLPPYKWVYSRMRTRELREFLVNNFSYLTRLYGGDSDKSSLILVKVDEFADAFNFQPLED